MEIPWPIFIPMAGKRFKPNLPHQSAHQAIASARFRSAPAYARIVSASLGKMTTRSSLMKLQGKSNFKTPVELEIIKTEGTALRKHMRSVTQQGPDPYHKPKATFAFSNCSGDILRWHRCIRRGGGARRGARRRAGRGIVGCGHGQALEPSAAGRIVGLVALTRTHTYIHECLRFVDRRRMSP